MTQKNPAAHGVVPLVELVGHQTPAAHGTGGGATTAPAAPAQKYPAGHGSCAAVVEFAGQTAPGAQGPLQSAVLSPRASPYVPAGQGAAVAFVEPAGHQKPAEQGSQAEAPPAEKLPAPHCVLALVLDAAGQELPGGAAHGFAVAFVEPAGQK